MLRRKLPGDGPRAGRSQGSRGMRVLYGYCDLQSQSVSVILEHRGRNGSSHAAWAR